MGCHHAVAAVDLGIVEAGAADARLQIVGNDQPGNASEETKHPDMRADPVGERLRPSRLRIGEAGCAEHRHEDLCLADLTGLAINNRDLLAGIVDEDLVAGRMLLAHRRRKPLLETAKEFTKATVAVTVGMRPAILLPQDEQGDTGLLELDGKIGPVWFCASSRALFDAVASEEFVLERIVGQFARQRPAQSNRGCALQIILHRTARYSQHDGNLAGARPASGKPQHLS